MLNIAYSISTELRESLNRIETLRHQILTTPISPKTETRMRWEATVARTYWALAASPQPLPKAEIIKLFALPNPKKISAKELEAIHYKQAMDFIRQEWLVNPRSVSFRVISTLSDILYARTELRGLLRVVAGQESAIKHVLDYLQAQAENPIVSGSALRAYLAANDALSLDNGRLANLAMYLLFYKAGYDCRGLIVMEEFWQEDAGATRQIQSECFKNGNYTVWLEYVAKGITAQLEKTILDIESNRSHTDIPSVFWELNDRQKQVLSLLEAPDSSITNRKVQKMFRISQITASRDLSKLATMGLLFSHGKGRSVYYTKA